MKKRILHCLSALLVSGFLVTGSVVVAEAAAERPEDFFGENALANEVITAMDEEGDIYVVEEECASVSEDGITTFTEENKNLNVTPTPTPTPEAVFFVNFNTKPSTQTTTYKDIGTNINGYLCGDYGADGIYLGTEGEKIKFMISGVTGLVDKSEVEVLAADKVASHSWYEVSNGRLYHKISINVYSANHGSHINNGPAPSYLKAGIKYYSYDGHYFYEDLSTMVSDYKAGNRDNSINSEEPFYNYYQFLPFRSYSTYSSKKLTSLINEKVSAASKMKNIGETLVDMQNTYGVNALLTAGIAANESGWGTSNICQTKNNLFGINAIDATPGESAYYYADVNACIKDYMDNFLSQQYFNPNNWKYRGAFLGNKASGMNLNYASDPYWGEKAAAAAWLLDENGGKKDQCLYTIGVKDPGSYTHTNLNVRKEATTASKSIYRTGTQPEHTFIILNTEPVDNFYKIQSDPVLTSDRTFIASGTGAYNRFNMYLYTSCNYITIVSKGVGKNLNTMERIFEDIQKDTWYYDCVDYIYKNGIMNGMKGHIFAPDGSMTRSQFATILYRLEGSPKVTYTNKFNDVPDKMWYTNAVIWANKAGIVTGYTDTLFGVEDNITREQIVTMMHRYAKYKKYNVEKTVSVSGYPDAGSISTYAKEALGWAVGNEIMQGKADGRLDPQGNTTRAEGAAIIMRFMNKYTTE